MIEVLSIVNFDNSARIKYLEQSFVTLHKYNKIDRHIIIDGSKMIEEQAKKYETLSNVEYYHVPESFSHRLKLGLSMLKSDYFIFYNDDYKWIFDFPIEQAINSARKFNITCVKLSAPGMSWYSEVKPKVRAWYNEKYELNNPPMITNGGPLKRAAWFLFHIMTNREKLVEKDNLLISRNRFFRSIYQRFNLAGIVQTEFVTSLMEDVPDEILTGGEIEKYFYKRLVFSQYQTAYYKMLTPMFHFIDLEVEGYDKEFIATTNLIEDNYRFIKKDSE